MYEWHEGKYNPAKRLIYYRETVVRLEGRAMEGLQTIPGEVELSPWSSAVCFEYKAGGTMAEERLEFGY